MRTHGSVRLAALAVLAATAGLLALTSCKSEDGGNQPAATTPESISVTRTGGFAGVNQKIEISPDGSWAHTDAKTNTTEQGTLTEAQKAQIQAAVSTAAFTEDLLKTPVAIDCADTFRYTITVGARSVMFDECDQANRPALMAAIAAVSDATPF